MLLINGSQTALYAEEMQEAFKLRHEIFVDEKGWEAIRRPDCHEVDEFDNSHALHMLMFEDGKLSGYQRMLPTTRPYLLSKIYPHLCEDDLPNDEHVWEWTRYAVRKEYRLGGRKLSPTSNRLLSGIVEWGLLTGVHSIVIEMNPIWMLRLVQLHFRVHPLGFAKKIDGEDTLAVLAKFDKRTLAKLQEFRGDSRPVIDFSKQLIA